ELADCQSTPGVPGGGAPPAQRRTRACPPTCRDAAEAGGGEAGQGGDGRRRTGAKRQEGARESGEPDGEVGRDRSPTGAAARRDRATGGNGGESAAGNYRGSGAAGLSR